MTKGFLFLSKHSAFVKIAQTNKIIFFQFMAYFYSRSSNRKKYSSLNVDKKLWNLSYLPWTPFPMNTLSIQSWQTQTPIPSTHHKPLLAPDHTPANHAHLPLIIHHARDYIGTLPTHTFCEAIVQHR